MACHEPTGRATEAPVSQERHRVSQALADDCTGYAKHLAHSRTALWALIADHDDVTRVNLSARNRGHRIFLRGGFSMKRRARKLPATGSASPSSR